MTNEMLASYIKQGSSELIPILWNNTKHLCFKICGQYYAKYAAKFTACGVELSDLRQESYGAFLKAIKAYKADNDAKFSTYLSYPLRNRAAELLGICNADRINHKPLDNAVSLDAPSESADNEGLCLGDTLPDERSTEPFENILDSIEDEDTRRVLTAAIKQLTEVQQRVIIQHYFNNVTLTDIGAELGVSGERARQIKENALKKLRYMPEVVILRREQRIEKHFHNRKPCTPDYYLLQKRINKILRNGGDLLSYGKKQAILLECAAGKKAADSPEYLLYLSLSEI